MPGLSRRQLLALAGAAATGAAGGCTVSSPVVRGGPTAPPPAPSPTPVPGAADGVGLELACAALAAGRAREEEPGGEVDARWQAVAAAHTEHARVLSLPDPVAAAEPAAGTPPGPDGSPAPTDGDHPDAAAAARSAHTGQAGASTGALALLWASLAGFAAAAPGAERVGTEVARPAVTRALPEPVALAELVAGLHAAVFGYEVALVPLDPAGEGVGTARDRRIQLLALRDDLSGALVAAGADVPAAAPDYRVELDPDDGPGSARLRRELELALQVRLGRWVQAAADPAPATSALVASVLTSTDLGAELSPWPGW